MAPSDPDRPAVDPERVRATVRRYLDAHGEADLDGVVEVFAPGAALEDPVGTPPRTTPDAIRDFLAVAHVRQGRLRLDVVGPIVVCGCEAAAHVHARSAAVPDAPVFDVLYVFVVDGDARVTSMRAFFEL